LSDEQPAEPLRYRRTISEEEKDKLAYELALGYYEHEELRRVIRILPEGWKALMESDNFRTRVTMKRREIDESPDALRIHARRAARVAIDEYAKLVKDPDAPAKTRMEAGRQLREYAMVADREALEDPNAGQAIIIRTNLDLQGAKGVYSITAADIEEQEAENAQLVRETHGDDFADLLGDAE
jgi:hypothetical protein